MKLLIAIGTAAVLTAACSASASVSGPGSSAAKTTNTLHLASGSNAGADAPGDLGSSRVNSPAGKTGTRPVVPAQSHAAAAAPAPGAPTIVIRDRCNGGIGNPPAAGNRGVPAAGKGLQLPACMPE